MSTADHAQARAHAGTEPRSPRVAERRARIRAALVAEGARLFAAKGIDQVSVEEILEAVGVSRRTFYGFFANKYELVAGALNPALDAGTELLDDVARRRAADLLPGLVDVYLQLWKHHRDALSIIGSLDAAVLPYIQDGHAAFGRALRAVLRQAEAAGALRNKSADYSFKVISRTAVPLLKIYGDHPDMAAQYTDAMLALLRAKGAGA